MQLKNITPLFSEESIKERIKELARQINVDYKDKELVVVGVLKGAFVFLADLVRHLELNLSIDFIRVSSYSGTKSTGQVKINLDLSQDVTGKHVLLIEDIVDTGRTVDFLMDLLRVKRPASVKICTLLSKPKVHKLKTAIDYVGFEIDDQFVLGYGLDLDGKYRELPFIGDLRSRSS